MAGKLTLICTPIGNLGDLSPRALEALREADFIAAEDTRVSLKLLNHFDVKKPLVSYYEHNRYSSGEKILERLLTGESCALVTDAGMPAISDPGEDIVAMCAENNVPVTCVPGPCAAVTALALSGLPTGRFTFEGFLSTTRRAREEHLDSLRREERTMIFYEAPHKLQKTLADMIVAFGEARRVTLCRELTKLYEEIDRTTLGEAAAKYADTPPRGEFVLVVAGAEPESAPEATIEEALELMEQYRAQGRSMKESARLAAADTGFSKNELYSMAIKN